MAMINKINTWSNPINKLYAWSTEVQKAYLWDTLIYGDDGATPLLKFTAVEANSTIAINISRYPKNATFEISTDAITWTDYTIRNTITLANIWDSIYIRNKSETVVWINNSTVDYYFFVMTWKIKADWDINYMLCKNSTTSLVNYSYSHMFANCDSLVQAPELPATSLADDCYNLMFYWCTNLVQAPSLPATSLARDCYTNMFSWCTSLVQAPSLPATNLARDCYSYMFYWCTSLVQAPELPATNLDVACYEYMFSWCTNLVQIPKLPATNLAGSCYYYMFERCNKIKLSTTQTSDYTQPYRIPTSWTWTTASYAMDFMFLNTWWTFNRTPTINTTYYVHKDNVIV